MADHRDDQKHTQVQTEIITVDPLQPNDTLLMPAAQAIREGKLVAFPTETVYGLGANALDGPAVARIFAVKGRPSDNPLIIHLADLDALNQLIDHLPPLAEKLFAAFSPGPLTLVLPRSRRVPDEVTAGLETVAIRLPAHPIARRLIQLAGVPVAAPSANRSGRPSPTRAWHVIQDLGGLIPYVVDGGACYYGLESTVVDVTGSIPVILRPGSITAEDIRRVAGSVSGAVDGLPVLSGRTPRAPGMKYRHYAPHARVIVVDGETPDIRLARMRIHLTEQQHQSGLVGVLACRRLLAGLPDEQIDAHDAFHAVRSGQADRQQGPCVLPSAYYGFAYGDEPDPDMAANALFHAMRIFDRLGVAAILAEGLPEDDRGAAYMNRLRKAAGTGQPTDEEVPRMAESADEPSPGKLILFVCTGNTCRSPMAAELFNQAADGTGYRAESAGLAAFTGDSATDAAVRVMASLGNPGLRSHRSRALTPWIVDRAAWILTMTASQALTLRQIFPEDAAKIRTLGEMTDHGQVSDPYGGDDDVYLATALQLQNMIARLIQVLQQADIRKI